MRKAYRVPYPERRPSEFEVQAKLYNKLLNKGFIVKGEVKAYKARFDLVVYDKNYKAICIIETKSWKKKRYVTPTKQLKKYRKFGVPVIVCGWMERVDFTVERVEKLFKSLGLR